MGSQKTFATRAWGSETFTFLSDRKVWEFAARDSSLVKLGLTILVCD